MPTYSAKCPNEHSFDYFCLVANRNDDDQRKCPECGELGERTWETSGSAGGHGFPMDHPHLSGDGTVVRVESLAHLRKLEKHYGVVVSGFSQDGSNQQDQIKNAPLYRAGGRDYEGPALAPNLRPKTKHWWDD